MGQARATCEPAACWLGEQWWGHEGRYCAEHADCWRAACQPAPVTIRTTAAA